jgi:hypothetical protein
MKLSPELRTRLVRLCGMLGSDFDGERASAGLLANRLIKSLDLTWEDVIRQVVETKQQQRPPWEEQQQDQDLPPSTKAKFCLDSGLMWNAWEMQFLQDMLYRSRCSEKQKAVLDRLHDKAKAKAATS